MTEVSAEHRLGLAPGLFPFRGHLREIAGAREHSVDGGSGPPLVMLHGNPTWSFQFRHLILALRSDFRCLALDLPGFGLSDPPPGFGFRPEEYATLVAGWLAACDLRGATLVAHDWGGPIGLAAACAEPGRITRFVLGNTWAWPLNGSFHFEWFSRLAGGPVGRFGVRRFNLFVNGLMPAAMRRGRLPPAVMQAYRAPFADPRRRTGMHVLPAALTGSRDMLARLERDLQAIDGRHVMFLWPDRDFAFRPVELARWRALFPAAQIVTLANCGHFLFEEAGAECAAAIAGWLATAPHA